MHFEQTPKVIVVVPFHNRIEKTIRFIHSFKAIKYQNCEIVFFDDGSTDGSAIEIRKILPEAHILTGDGSHFWTRSVNEGIRFASTRNPDFVLTMNNDVEVTPDFLTELVKTALETAPSLVHPKIFYKGEGKRLFYGGGKLVWGSGHMCWMRPFGEFDEGQYADRREVDFLPGMCMLIPVGCFQKTGLFDHELFPQYYADHDFSMRAKEANFSLIFEPRSVIYNDGDSTGIVGINNPVSLKTALPILFSIRSPWHFRSNWRFHRRHCPVYLIPYSLLRFYLWVYSYMYIRRKLRQYFNKSKKEIRLTP